MSIESAYEREADKLTDENERLRKALSETARRLQHLRNELSGRLSGDAATKFFGVTDTTISLIEDSLK